MVTRATGAWRSRVPSIEGGKGDLRRGKVVNGLVREVEIGDVETTDIVDDRARFCAWRQGARGRAIVVDCDVLFFRVLSSEIGSEDVSSLVFSAEEGSRMVSPIL